MPACWRIQCFQRFEKKYIGVPARTRRYRAVFVRSDVNYFFQNSNKIFAPALACQGSFLASLQRFTGLLYVGIKNAA
jgi:hypothetical protein